MSADPALVALIRDRLDNGLPITSDEDRHRFGLTAEEFDAAFVEAVAEVAAAEAAVMRFRGSMPLTLPQPP